MIEISPDTMISRASGHISTELDGELMLMDIEQGKYFGLKGSALRIWSLVEQPCSFGELCARLREQYKAPPGKIDADARIFVTRLVEQKLLTLA